MLFLIITVLSYMMIQYFLMYGTQASLVQMKLMFITKLSVFWYVI